ncbi:MAG TPA: hypothetical protein VK619_18470, partial [Pyrinomonadaceae bacterium]|nr:hypothetical protein [Pyrinomonadaceae bacterium]
FVDALIQSARQSSNVDLTTHRAELLSTYDAGTSLVNKRAVTLRKLIDYTEYAQAEFNPAFVLMQYFGYLRRDVDTGGYTFWLGILNNLPAPNNFRNMVCAFITSGEYQLRFGTTVTRHNSDCASN